MNPEVPQVRSSPESMPQIPGGVEYFPDGTSKSPEKVLSPEQHTSQVEELTQAAQAIPYVGTSALPVPPPPPPAVTIPVTHGAPVAAADEDLIEKEWVDKVKNIIALTRGNPHEQAKAIAALQADYLKKRYNRELGESSA